ncbi:hypothetical protein D3C80_1939350 [compost metagenome]
MNNVRSLTCLPEEGAIVVVPSRFSYPLLAHSPWLGRPETGECFEVLRSEKGRQCSGFSPTEEAIFARLAHEGAGGVRTKLHLQAQHQALEMKLAERVDEGGVTRGLP